MFADGQIVQGNFLTLFDTSSIC